MKRIIIGIVFFIGSCFHINAQDWMTSLEVAKNLATVQGKLLFAIWEDASYDPYPVLIRDNKGNTYVDDLFANESINEVIWEYFVPVIISESKYETLFNDIDGKRNVTYIDKFNDDTIKIMDANGNIINTTIAYYEYLDIEKFIKTYALDTSILSNEIKFYQTNADFNTTYRLTSKYIDYAVLIENKKVRSEFITLSNYYLKEALAYIVSEDPERHKELEQKVMFQNMKQQLVLNKPKKVLRRLKKIEASEVSEANSELWAFLNYTAHLLLQDEAKASIWRTKLSLVNLKKANLIVKSNS